MFRNYLKIAIRLMWKHKLFSFINIFGLAMSMAVGLIIIMVVKEAYSYDRFHPDSDRLFRIITEVESENGVKRYASSPLPLAERLTRDYDLIEKSVKFRRTIGVDALANNKIFFLNGVFTEPSFFDLFAFELKAGNIATALREPNSVILSEETANKYFKNENPIGKLVRFEQFEADLKVTGILKKPSQNTRYEMDFYASWSSLPTLEKNKRIDSALDSWADYKAGHLYVRIKKGVKKIAVQQALSGIAESINPSIHSTRLRRYAFELQAFHNISPPKESLDRNFGSGRTLTFIYAIVAVGLILLLSACFNYTNLSIARSLSRAREVGVRKVTGATRSQVFFQFITEAILFSLLSLSMAYLILSLVKDIGLVNRIVSGLKQNAELWIYFLSFSILTGLLAGCIPAWVLSAFKPVQTLKNLKGVRFFKGLALRKTLIVIQFSVSLIFMISLMVIWLQSQFMLKTNYGFDKENIVHVNLLGTNYNNLKAEWMLYNQVESVTASSNVLGTFVHHYANIQKREDDPPLKLGYFAVDKNFPELLKLKLVAGSTFPSHTPDSVESYILLNETAIQLLKLGNPQEAIGKTVVLEELQDVKTGVATIKDRVPLIVIGVLKDFFYQNMMFRIDAMGLRFQPGKFRVASVKLRSAGESSIASLRNGWKRVNTLDDFNYWSYSDEFEDLYGHRQDMATLLFLTLLTISLSCLGILGISTYTAETRIKEVGIRKVMGAGVTNIVLLLSKNLLLLIGIAGIIALPAGFIIGKMILQFFANQVEFSIWILLAPLSIMVILALLAIVSQTLRTAMANPIGALRSE